MTLQLVVYTELPFSRRTQCYLMYETISVTSATYFFFFYCYFGTAIFKQEFSWQFFFSFSITCCRNILQRLLFRNSGTNKLKKKNTPQIHPLIYIKKYCVTENGNSVNISKRPLVLHLKICEFKINFDDSKIENPLLKSAS